MAALRALPADGNGRGAGGRARRSRAAVGAAPGGGTPLAKLLPDEAAAKALARRTEIAEQRVREIDALLARREFSEDAALARIAELKARGSSDAAVSHASIRLHNARRLRALRDRFERELDEVRELVAQLAIQAEVVRLAGVADPSSEALVRELVIRVEGLDEILQIAEGPEPSLVHFREAGQ